MTNSRRRTAAQAGERFFTSAKPCKRDGSQQRYTVNGVCVQCAKARAAKDYAMYRGLLDASKTAKQA